MLKLEGVAKQYLYGKRLFGAVDMTLENGEILSILGLEGSGKTTFLKTVAGIEEYEGIALLKFCDCNAFTITRLPMLNSKALPAITAANILFDFFTFILLTLYYLTIFPDTKQAVQHCRLCPR